MTTHDFYVQQGSMIAGRYKVEDIIGQGFTAIILRCHDCTTRRDVAIKRFFPEKLTLKLRKKAYAESRLNIRGEYFVVGQETFEENGYLNMVMPLIKGESLRDILDMHCDGIGIAPAIYTALCLAKACIQLHAARVLSTDIKPGNVMILPNGIAKLIDFSCFEIVGKRAEVSLGTIPYAAPELLCHSYLSSATDIYSIGVVLTELVLGADEFNKVAESLEQSIKRGQKPDISSVRRSYPEIARIVDRAIEPRPERRYGNAGELFGHLFSHYNTISGGIRVDSKELIFVCGNGKELCIQQGRFVIGRSNIDYMNDFISEKHLEVDFDGREVKIKDAGSRNGTFINGTKLDGRWERLHDSDIIRIADICIKVKMSQ